MGNCVFKGGYGEVEEMVKVVTSSGGIMELFAPITAECITNEFPGHAIYRTRDLFSQPLLHNEELHAGHLYYLLPLPLNNLTNTTTTNNNMSTSSSRSASMNTATTPYRMSFDQQQSQRVLKRSSEAAEVLPRYNGGGVWKVKLVISPEQLAEILAQEARTEALIESVRTVAKCGNSGLSSAANSDQWSLHSTTLGRSYAAEDRW